MSPTWNSCGNEARGCQNRFSLGVIPRDSTFVLHRHCTVGSICFRDRRESVLNKWSLNSFRKAWKNDSRAGGKKDNGITSKIGSTTRIRVRTAIKIGNNTISIKARIVDIHNLSNPEALREGLIHRRWKRVKTFSSM